MDFALKRNAIDWNQCNTYINRTVVIVQIEGGEFQLDLLSCWHDNGDSAIPVLIPVVGREVGRLDNTGADGRPVATHIATGFASAQKIYLTIRKVKFLSFTKWISNDFIE
jgi:hypothetical protein